MDYSFNVEAALRYGVNGAIFIQNLFFWIKKNEANGKHFYDGTTWTYNSSKALSILFPFWSEDQIDRIVKKLVSVGAVKAGNFNTSAMDRTRWYALSQDVLSLYETPLIRGSHLPKSRETSREIAGAIPDSKPDSKPDIESDLSFFNDGLRDELKKWLAYKGQKKQKYTPIGRQSFLAKTKRAAETFGEPAVIELIELSIINGWAGVVWEKLKTDPPKERRKTLD